MVLFGDRCSATPYARQTTISSPSRRPMRSAYPVVVFDLDGTLLRGTTVSLLLAEWVGRAQEVADLERAFYAHEISNRVVAETQAAWFAGLTLQEIWPVLKAGPWISGMAETFNALSKRGVGVLVGTITWSFAAQMLCERYTLDAHSGTEMPLNGDGTLTGTVSRYFDEHDKARFVEEWCSEHGYSMSHVAAVGDSRSDIPLFDKAGMSIALNASPQAKERATHVLDSEDLRDVLPILEAIG